MNTALKLENVSKQYRLGVIGTGTIAHDLNRWWALLRGKEDPYSKIGEVNAREVSAAGEYVWALKDIDLEVEKGEILGIIGANGAGKSTLLKLLSRVTAPTTGSIKGRGRIASLLEVGTGFHPELTGRENIYMNGAVLGMRRFEITERLEEIVEFSGCQKYLDTPVKRYSSGMTVRLGFAVAAHLSCETLIVDEVLAVGDLEFQKKCIGKMREVGQSGRTILLVSHNMGSIRKLAQRAILLKKGRLEASGNTEDILEEYSNIIGEHPALIHPLHAQADLSKGMIKQIEILDAADLPNTHLKSCVPWKLKFQIELFRSFDNLMLSWSLRTLDDAPVRISWNPLGRTEPGKYQVVVDCGDVHISKGTYLLSCGLSENELVFHRAVLKSGIEIGPGEEIVAKFNTPGVVINSAPCIFRTLDSMAES